MERSYSGIDERSEVRHLLTGIQENAVQPMACQVLAREKKKRPSQCVWHCLLTSSVTLKRTLPTCATLPRFAAVGVAAAGAMTLEEEVVGVDIGLVEKPFQHTCLYHLQDCVVNGDYLAI
jgi:hypothetical protein